jgi:hypothetical protein
MFQLVWVIRDRKGKEENQFGSNMTQKYYQWDAFFKDLRHLRLRHWLGDEEPCTNYPCN